MPSALCESVVPFWVVAYSYFLVNYIFIIIPLWGKTEIYNYLETYN